jgi:hypothetical protein
MPAMDRDDHNESQGVDREQDPFVERSRPDPGGPPEPTITLAGFLGKSDRPGHRRLYFTRDLDYYAEFRDEDVVRMDSIPADAPPFVGDESTRVTLRRDATFEFTRTHTGRPLDEFDLDMRTARSVELEMKAPKGPIQSITCWFTCPGTPGLTCYTSCCPIP